MHPATELLMARLKALADPLRLRLVALCRHGECSVSELVGVTGTSQPRVSQQLKLLCEAGLLERFRDGQRVYYRLRGGGRDAAPGRAALRLLPPEEPQFDADAARLLALRGESLSPPAAARADDGSLHRALLDLTIAEATGDLLDVGCGRGRLLKLLSPSARRAVGVDIDASARQLARAELLLAGLDNCTLRKGDMYRLPFDDGGFDTVLLDDVLGEAEHPLAALTEARRQLKPGGRLILLERLGSGDEADSRRRELADWCAAAELRVSPARQMPGWLLAVARPAEPQTAAA